MRKKKIKEMNMKEINGYTFGMKSNPSLNLKDMRRDKVISIKKSLDNVFNFENVTSPRNYDNRRMLKSSESIREKLKSQKKEQIWLKIQKRKRKMDNFNKRQIYFY